MRSATATAIQVLIELKSIQSAPRRFVSTKRGNRRCLPVRPRQARWTTARRGLTLWPSSRTLITIHTVQALTVLSLDARCGGALVFVTPAWFTCCLSSSRFDQISEKTLCFATLGATRCRMAPGSLQYMCGMHSTCRTFRVTTRLQVSISLHHTRQPAIVGSSRALVKRMGILWQAFALTCSDSLCGNTRTTGYLSSTASGIFCDPQNTTYNYSYVVMILLGYC